MFTVQRIYDYRPAAGQTAVFIDRLYPRGVTKEKFAAAEWLKAIAPSAELRRWYHEDPAQHFAAFVTRYHEELQGETQQKAVAHLLELEKQHGARADTDRRQKPAAVACLRAGAIPRHPLRLPIGRLKRLRKTIFAFRKPVLL